MVRLEMQGIVNDLVRLNAWSASRYRISVKNEASINLLTGEVFEAADGSPLANFLKDKHLWFLDRLKKEKIFYGDLAEAKLSVLGSKEKVRVSYKGSVFTAG